LSLVTMEQPGHFEAEAVRDARTRALEAVRPIDPADAVRGQYGAGTRNGERLASYRDEKRVPPDSRTETYVALKLTLDSPRWQGTAFYLRTGKHLAARRTEIALHLKPPQDRLFDSAPESMLLLEIDPQQGVRMVFPVKQPGPSMRLHPVAASFSYGDFFEILPSVGYETLLYDCMRGDPMLFQRADTIEAAWRAVQPLLDRWADDDTPPEIYRSGSEGPRGAVELLARDGRKWRKLEE
jgi:glucose-6-phosphate 1-dehydrogenase